MQYSKHLCKIVSKIVFKHLCKIVSINARLLCLRSIKKQHSKSSKILNSSSCPKGIDKQYRPRSDCLDSFSDQGIPYLLFLQGFCEL